MKISKLLLSAVLGSVLLLASCKKEEETPAPAATPAPTPVDTAYKFTYKVNGTAFNPTGYTALYYNTTSNKGIYISLQGVIKSPINLRVQNNNVAGTYPLSSSVIAVYNPTMGMDDDCFGTTGTIVITSVGNGKVSGTFSFTGEDSGVTYSITEGEFKNIPY